VILSGPLPTERAARDGHGLSPPSWEPEFVSEIVFRTRSSDPSRVEALSRRANVPRVIAELLLARGVETAEAVSRFFSGGLLELGDPFRMKGIEEASGRLVAAARSGRRIVVFGDYDVDGVTAVAQLRAALTRAGADVVAYLPHRLRDGYGLKPDTVRRVLQELAPALIVTVDCGITAVEGVACARAAGVDVIVTDHHLVPEQLPSGAIVVNPKQPGCGYPEKELAATGIAMKLASAVAQRAGVGLAAESLLRVACLGTIADLVPLTGENRVIAAAGLAALASARAPGLSALLAECGVAAGRGPTSEEVAFRLAPRLNAAGRLDTAHLALSLFAERDPSRATAIARELSRRNAERQGIERRVVAEARERIQQECDPENDVLLVACAPGWHRGVLGIAASRIAREYHRPVLLFAEQDGRCSGSGRSVPGVPLHDTLKTLSSFFEEFGGHDQAVGATLRADRFAAFRDAARAVFADTTPPGRLERVEEADADLGIEEATAENLASWLARFEPHGMANPRPVFAARGVRLAPRLRPLGDSGGVAGRLEGPSASLEFLCWKPGPLSSLVAEALPVDVHYRLHRDRDGRLEAELVAARGGARQAPSSPTPTRPQPACLAP
jgi:single-stranded-DNA-specific exonuclease